MWRPSLSLMSVIAALPLLVGTVEQRTIAADAGVPVHLVGHEDIELLDRVQDLIDDWDPRKLQNPVVETAESQLPDGKVVRRKQLKRADLVEFIADVEAAEALGKAFFWDMQAGSDFRRLADGETYVGTACASCHHRNGADARSRHTVRIPYVVWDRYELDPAHPLEFGEQQLPFDVTEVARYDVTPDTFGKPFKFGFLSTIIGSAGVEPRVFERLNAPAPPSGAWESEQTRKRTVEDYKTYPLGYRPEWSMFLEGHNDAGRRFRQITARNSPSVINAVFSDRLFHDGRAESTFNGFSIFGDRDGRPVLYRGVPREDADGRVATDPNTGVMLFGPERPVKVHVAVTQAALASQAVGPVINDVEMSYTGRSFPNLACKLLDAKVLGFQDVADDDSILGPWKQAGLIGKSGTLTYRDLIRRAFRREWWDGGTDAAGMEYQVPLVLMGTQPEDVAAEGPIVVANFSLFWGLSIMLYEASLVSNHSPFDEMMRGRPELVERRWSEAKADLGDIRLDRATVNGVPAPFHTTGAAVFQHGFRVFLRSGCIECHSGPLFSELYERRPEQQQFSIHQQLTNTLLPNSRADAIAARRSQFHDQTLRAVAALIAGDRTISPQRAAAWARELDLLREQARGNGKLLQQLIESRLGGGPSALAKAISDRLMSFEKTAVEHYGGRTNFFTEDERVPLAEQLTLPVLVEKMPFAGLERPPLPIQGPLANEKYAFYDLSFYAIGVSSPRYDPGNGQWEFASQFSVVERVREELQQEAAAMELTPTEATAERKVVLRRYLGELEEYSKSKVANEISQELRQRIKAAYEDSRALRPHRGTAGQNNRFRGGLPAPSDAQPDAALEAVPAKARSCEQGPSYDPDRLEKDATELPRDMTWMRNDLPLNERRSSLVFYSRSRTLVADEEPWGYRKPFLHDNELAFWGAFKTPTLRNVELTAPYMHNGRLRTLSDVIEFYDRDGDIEFDRELYPDKHPEMVGLDMPHNDQLALEFFLMCLTDDRVRLEQAPFDHPSLQLVHGYDAQLRERVFPVKAIGSRGWQTAGDVPPRFPHHE